MGCWTHIKQEPSNHSLAHPPNVPGSQEPRYLKLTFKYDLVSDDADDEVQDTLKILKVAELIDVTLLRMESKMVLKIRIN